MQITLINCLPKLQGKGLNVGSYGWVDALSVIMEDRLQLDCCCWSYDHISDVLIIEMPELETMPVHIAEFGEVVVDDGFVG